MHHIDNRSYSKRQLSFCAICLTLCKKGLKMAQCILQHENQKIIYLKDSIDFNLDDYANNVVYDFCYKDIKTQLYKKRIRLSLIVDLKKDIETIFEDFKPNTRNEINKAEKLNLNIDNNVTLDDLYKMHNKMLESKGLKLVDKTFYFGLSQKPIITSISPGGGGEGKRISRKIRRKKK